MYSEFPLNRQALGPNNVAGLEGWPFLWDFLCNKVFDRDFKKWLIFREISVEFKLFVSFFEKYKFKQCMHQ
jgi:hypothetical protein